ncbi:calmodulin-regulated spectrin-associated protein 1-B-like isoform X2 [Dunckerocampus dactyliophorus]|uniref:calmodulin-regulated spectrin-associated protein 1-B-like isoform X2 n=1 Tax=Dunckerocampus dactyliophorus TaxID=161453 RepID=UPI002404C6AC|nr:calmodulin-regulated spectrin-associated protein 1-B-like isoform X2 [Dunckerocampus dactyliophorus]
MDVEVSAGQGGSTRRRAEEDGGEGGGGMEVLVVPLDLYDSARAKIEANLRWLLAKAYGIDHIPEDLRDPFYTDQYEQEHIKPPVIHLLLSGEIYCRVCRLILRAEQAASLQSPKYVLQALSSRGIHVLDSEDTHISTLDLSAVPVKISPHMHLIDALMMAYTMEMISVEKVVSSVKRFSNFSASKERPFDLEDAMVFWINKVTTKMRAISEKELKMKQHLLDSPSHEKVRYRRDHLSGRTLQHFPLVDDLCKDVCDGAALLALIHFYCPEVIRLEDICLKDVLSIADSMYNIQLLKEFSNKYLNKCFYLKPEDMLYCPLVLRNNMMVFIAELFWWFEIVKPDFVQPRDLKETRDARLLLQPKSSRPHASISSVTKRSFSATVNAADILTSPPIPDPSTVKSTTSAHHSLVPLRQRHPWGVEDDGTVRNLCNSLTRTDEKFQCSPQARPERRQRPLSQPAPYALHFPSPEDNADSISLARSISKDSLASNIMTPKHMLGSGRQLHQHRLSGQSLLSHIRIEDEEEILEEEELVAVIHPSAFPIRPHRSDMEQDELEIPNTTSPRRISNTNCSPCLAMDVLTPDLQADSYYLEPLLPAIPKPAKEKSVILNKEEESGESRFRSAQPVMKTTTDVPHKSQRKSPVSECSKFTFKPTAVVDSVPNISLPPPRKGSTHTSMSVKKQPQGFFLHLSGEPDCHSHLFSDPEVGLDSDSDIADFEEDDEDGELIDQRGKGTALVRGQMCEFSEVESAKLREDLKLSERDDKDDGSGRSSPCLSTVSCASSCSASGSASVRMTSFAERKLLKLSLREGFSSTSSSQKTTPDHSEITPWQLKSEGSPGWQGKDPGSVVKKTIMESPPVVPSELLQLHMQLEEQRRAIEYQKKRMETLSARQRLKLGKAAFLNIVKKGEGKSDTLPLPLKHSPSAELSGAEKVKTHSCKDDSCLEVLKVQAKAEGRQMNIDNRLKTIAQFRASESDMNDCSHSIDLLNEAISAIQQQMQQLSLQQDLLMKKTAVSPPEPKEPDQKATPNLMHSPTLESKAFAVHFVDFSDSNSTPTRRPPKLSSSQRSKTSDPKQGQKNGKMSDTEGATSPRESTGGGQDAGVTAESSRQERNFRRRTTFRIHNDQGSTKEERCLSPVKAVKSQSQDTTVSNMTPSHSNTEHDENKVDSSGTESVGGEESTRIKGQLIEVDLSELKEPAEDASADMTDGKTEGEQKNVLGFFFKDEEKAEDEMAKRRAAFLLKQQRKAEEARLRKQQQGVESELKRDEARRKAEEDRVRKEEEKARRELIKQEYLRRKQQALMEEQGQVKPRPRLKSRKSRPKSLHRGDFNSPCKGSTTPDLSCSHRGSTLSLATEADSVISGEAESQRAESVCSTDSFPVLSRASSRNMERDWESGSIASSITSTEYNGPKLFKEPSSKSNKPIIINAIAHCCLAGKVNEAQKNIILEELEKCESNHLIILFRDGGCQFRAVYSYTPDTEEIVKFTGMGPRIISHKMIDRLYKYSSDRKQFTVIPAKSVSASVDALTIHNHLWQVKRPGSARKK